MIQHSDAEPPGSNTPVKDTIPDAAARYLGAVELVMLDLLRARSGTVVEAAVAAVAAGGKRLRPLLVFAASSIASPPTPAVQRNVIRAGAAVELLHTASLIHDDVLDAAQLRRGTPTVHSEHGLPIAVASGDLLFSQAFRALLDTRADAEPHITERAVQRTTQVSRILAEGEALQAEQIRDVSLSQEAYLDRCQRKTGELFGLAMELAGLFTGAHADEVDLLGRYGRDIGIAFQLADDVLDCSPDATAASLGKQPGADLRDGTITLPMLVALHQDPSLTDVLAQPVTDVEAVLHRIANSGALATAIELAQEQVADAEALLESLDERRFNIVALREIAHRAVVRLS